MKNLHSSLFADFVLVEYIEFLFKKEKKIVTSATIIRTKKIN